MIMIQDVSVAVACISVMSFVAFVQNSPNKAPAENKQVVATSAQVTASKDDSNYLDKAMLISMCEIAIKPDLKNPSSFDADVGTTTVYDYNGNLSLDMFYYAENSYGATILNEVFCDFTPRGTLIQVAHVQ